jgi:hypothetical protein
MVGHYILVSYLSRVRVCSAFLTARITVALRVAADFNIRRWAQFVLALSNERDMLVAKIERDLQRTHSNPDSLIDSQLGCILWAPGQ